MPIAKALTALLSGAAVVLSAACSPVKTLNAIIPDKSYTLTRSVAYGSSARQILDIYTPKSLSKQPMPVVVFFYGGSWDSGDKTDYKFVAEALASHGYLVVIPDYRVYPEVLFPGFMQDAALATKWVKQYIAEYGGDTQHVFLGGHSAGAYIAAMLLLDHEYLAAQGLLPQDFAAMFGLAGPYDFLPLTSQRLKTIFSAVELAKSQPINFVQGDNPPMLLLVGKQDNTVWPRNSYHLADKIKAAGGRVEVAEFADYGHIDMVAKLAKPLRGDGELLNTVLAFLQKH